MLAALKSWASAAGRWLWLAISALALLWAVQRVRSAEKAAEAARERYEGIYHDEQAEDAEKVAEAMRRHSEAQAKRAEERRKTEARIDELAKRDENLADLMDRWRANRLRDEHEAGSV